MNLHCLRSFESKKNIALLEQKDPELIRKKASDFVGSESIRKSEKKMLTTRVRREKKNKQNGKVEEKT